MARRLTDLLILLAGAAALYAIWHNGDLGDLLEAPQVTTMSDGQIAYASPADLLAARAKVDTLDVAGRAPKTGYSREEFGSSWPDVDGNGCDTRNDILARDYTEVRYADAKSCKVGAGTLVDPYSGELLSTPGDSDIDHVVALSNAWQMGAWQWAKEQRIEFANDPANLMAVSASQNRQKGNGDAATWLPANKAYRCTYVSKQVEVKYTYSLRVTKAEKVAIVELLDGCLR